MTSARVLALVLALVPRLAAADPAERSDDLAITIALGGGLIGGVAYTEAIAHTDYSTSDRTAVYATAVVAELLPSLAHVYAGLRPAMTWGLVLRAAGLGLMNAAFEDPSDGDGGIAFAVFLVGGGIFATSFIVDAVVAHHTVVRRRAAARAMVAPVVLRSPSGPVMGLGVGGRF